MDTNIVLSYTNILFKDHHFLFFFAKCTELNPFLTGFKRFGVQLSAYIYNAALNFSTFHGPPSVAETFRHTGKLHVK